MRNGIGVHHAGMLPKYRRLVEQLAQSGLLTVICGTDTLGVGINVPIRTVLFTGLAKFDGNRQRVLRTREFQQIAGRAGRAGYDTAGYVVVQAPEHVIDNERAKKKAEAKNAAPGANAKRKSKAQLKKPPEGTVVWTEQTYDKLVAGVPEQLTSRMRVDNAMLINVATREEDAFAVMRRLLTDNHEDRRQQLRLSRRALRLARSLVRTGVLTRLDELDEHGRRYVLTVDLPADFALNQPLAHFALAALDVLDPESDTYTLDIVSVIESVLEAPRQILMAQQFAARGEAVSEMKADGIEYEERMALLDQITWPQPLAELLGGALRDLPRAAPVAARGRARPQGGRARAVGAGDGVHRLRQPLPARALRGTGAALPHRRLPHAAPDRARTRTAPPSSTTSSSGWARRSARPTPRCSTSGRRSPTPTHVPGRVVAHEPPPPPRPVSKQAAPVHRDDPQRHVGPGGPGRRATTWTGCCASSARPPTGSTRRAQVVVGRSVWDAAIEAYYADHDSVVVDGDARGRTCSTSVTSGRVSPSAPRRGPRPGCATYARRSTTPPATTTG